MPPPFGARPSFGHALTGTTNLRWVALQDAGWVVAALAGIAPEKPGPEIRDLPVMLRNASERVRERVGFGIDDLAAVMEAGLSALLAAKASGADASAPALALWREFTKGRAALFALVPPSGTANPARIA